jgi:hypothetical protein
MSTAFLFFIFTFFRLCPADSFYYTGFFVFVNT